MQWFKGDINDFINNEDLKDNPLWVDYQVLGPMFSAMRVFFSMNDVLVVIAGAKGCAYHLNFTMTAWGETDFFLGKRPLPVLEYSQQQIISGDLSVNKHWMKKLCKLIEINKTKFIVILPTDSMTISGADMSKITEEIQRNTGIKTAALDISAISGPNQWAGYDAALKTLYMPYMNEEFEKEKSVNLVGWMWPSRHRGHEIGCCVDMLEEIGVKVNSVITGGTSIEDIEKSMKASANAVVCSSVMGETLQLLDEKGIKLAGPRSPYGFSGTREWLISITEALDIDAKVQIDEMEERYRKKFEENKEKLRGKKVFVSGGPGRLIGLLHCMIDYETDIQVAAMFWPHEWTKSDIKHMLAQHNLKVNEFILSPGLDDLERVANEYDFDVWLGGYQEQHTCKRHNIPFVPITVYTVPHVGFEGAVNLGNKLIMAMDGYSFTESVFQAKEIEGCICPKKD